ncbi:MAG: aminotransferase class I/II-fold pyridoxal phosphate-dependent enzyme [Solobacterium sp.]|nr:aminotransferase class I/II-fold pyridoxal phosphate-dependent enzyme [Solobacterium sp.]
MMKDCLNEVLYTARRSQIREFSALAKATPGCIALTLGEPDFDTPAEISAEVMPAIERGETHYIENNGRADLRRAIAEFENKKNGLDYTPDEVIVTAGATQALFTSLFSILNPGDEVIAPTPAFILYEDITNMCRGKFVPLNTSDDDFQINPEKLNALITDKTKAIVLNTPNNPTGTALNQKSMQAVYDAVKGKDIFVICDDVYQYVIFSDNVPSFTDFHDLREQTILVQSFSKPYAMTGWRIGYLCADASIIDRMQLAHAVTITSTPAMFQSACIKALTVDPTPYVQKYKERKDFIVKRIQEIGLPLTEPDGAFYVFPRIDEFGLSSTDFCRRMIKEAGLAATPGACFGDDRFIRFSYAASDEDLKNAMERLEMFIGELRTE